MFEKIPRIFCLSTLLLFCWMTLGKDVLFVKNESGFDVYIVEVTDGKISLKQGVVIYDGDTYDFAGISNGLLVATNGSDGNIEFSESNKDDFFVRKILIPGKKDKYRISAAKDGNLIALVYPANGQTKVEIFRWGQKKPLWNYRVFGRIDDFLISDDGAYFIFWTQEFGTRQFLLRAINIAEQTEILAKEIPAGLGFSNLWPLQVDYANSSIWVKSLLELDKEEFFRYTVFGKESKISSEDYYEATHQYFRTADAIFIIRQGECIPLLRFSDYFNSNEHVNRYAVSDNRKYICVMVGLSIYLIEPENKAKIKLQDKVYSDYFCWSR